MPNLLQVIGLDKVLANLRETGRQLKFATAQAINDTARDVQQLALDDLLPGAFTLRARGQPWQKPGSKFGFNVRPFATKENPTATVGSQADWLKEQEAGGTRTRSGHRLAIVAEARPTPTSVLPKQVKPRRLLSGNRPRGFLMPIRKGGPTGIWLRESDGRLRLMYVLQPSVRVEGRLHFEDKGAALAEKNFGINFTNRFARALATTK
jgi:hypothetical protein